MNSVEKLRSLERRIESENESDRWAAAAELSEYVFEQPDLIWPMVPRLGSSEVEDIRQAIATNALEHILERHFEAFFPALESEISKGNENLRDTLRLCWKFGESLEPSRARRWEALVSRLETK